MDKTEQNVVVSTAPGGAPPAGCTRGPAKPALDLSLGHFGTSEDVREMDLVHFGPYTVVLDYGAMTVGVDFEPSPPVSRQVRRAKRRKVDRLVAEALRSGMSLVETETEEQGSERGAT